MRTRDGVLFAWQALSGHRLRTLLSVAGLAVGIAAVVSLTALGEGARRYVTREFTTLGSQLVIVLPGKVETSGGMPFGGVTHDLTLEDVRALETRIASVRKAAPVSMGSETIHFARHSRSAAVVGTTSDFLEVRRLRVVSGRFLSPGELDRGRAEVVLGARVARELFADGRALGQVVRIGAWRFRVVGVLEARGRGVGFDLDDLVIVPVQTAMSMFNRHSLFRVLIEVSSHESIPGAREDVLRLMTERHRAEDVTVITQDAVLSSFGAILTALTLTVAGIASISLTVAGVGIMNVMLVSVTERRTEIGLLKALGASRREVLLVFLIEALLLACAGGLLGLAAGSAATAFLVSLYPTFPAAPPLWALLACVLLSFGVGAVFGLWPARQAMRLDPVAALSRR